MTEVLVCPTKVIKAHIRIIKHGERNILIGLYLGQIELVPKHVFIHDAWMDNNWRPYQQKEYYFPAPNPDEEWEVVLLHNTKGKWIAIPTKLISY